MPVELQVDIANRTIVVKKYLVNVDFLASPNDNLRLPENMIRFWPEQMRQRFSEPNEGTYEILAVRKEDVLNKNFAKDASKRLGGNSINPKNIAVKVSQRVSVVPIWLLPFVVEMKKPVSFCTLIVNMITSTKDTSDYLLFANYMMNVVINLTCSSMESQLTNLWNDVEETKEVSESLTKTLAETQARLTAVEALLNSVEPTNKKIESMETRLKRNEDLLDDLENFRSGMVKKSKLK